MKKPWGFELQIDAYCCNSEKIRDAKFIKQYVKDLCKLIDMKTFGKTIVVHFGEDEKVAGYSMTQLIQTSLISGHFANLTNTAYINIFSCKKYDVKKAIDFTVNSFEAKKYKKHYTKRY